MSTATSDKEKLTKFEAATIFDLSPATIDRYRRRGLDSTWSDDRKCFLYSAADIADYRRRSGLTSYSSAATDKTSMTAIDFVRVQGPHVVHLHQMLGDDTLSNMTADQLSQLADTCQACAAYLVREAFGDDDYTVRRSFDDWHDTLNTLKPETIAGMFEHALDSVLNQKPATKRKSRKVKIGGKS